MFEAYNTVMTAIQGIGMWDCEWDIFDAQQVPGGA